ncbi:hypothetical protein A9Q76_03565 [Arcobacter sp. 31_11_sub10_T18]|nr:hypothetical protein A9Q76_03565 [Arcobacter sp. 31_11_sub10_T18]
MKSKIKHYFQNIILPYILQLFVKFVYYTSKKNFHHPKLDTSKTYVIGFWHGELLMQPFNYHKLKKGTVKAMISDHKDGEAITRIVEHLNIGSVRGSSSKGGLKALINAIRELKSGVEVAITPDGPRGPRHSVADGIVAIAQKTSLEILIFNCKPTSYWQLKSWDKFVIPKPFGTINFYISEPLNIQDMEMDEAKKVIQEKMLINALI